MERKIRIWLGLGAAVLVSSGTTTNPEALAGALAAETGSRPDDSVGISPNARPFAGLIAQAEGGEGGEEAPPGAGTQALADYRLASTKPDAFKFDGKAQVSAYAALVHESYLAAHAEALKMQTAINAFLANPNPQTLIDARNGWVAARAAYTPTEAFRFYGGPIDGDNGPEVRLNSWPVIESVIDYVEGNAKAGLVNNTAKPVDLNTIVAMNKAHEGPDVTAGWHAIEFLLWGEDTSATGPGARPHTDYIAGQATNDRRRDYLRLATDLLVYDLSFLTIAWAPDNSNYRSSLTLMDQRNAIGRVFHGLAAMTGFEMPVQRIGVGLKSGDPKDERSRFSDNTHADLVNNLRGIRNVYFGSRSGTGAAGFDKLVASIDPAANSRVVAAFTRAEQALAALDQPYDRVLAARAGSSARSEAQAAVKSLHELAEALRTAGNRLGVLVLIPTS